MHVAIGSVFSVGVPEGVMHDPDVLPHMYAQEDVEMMFPRASVGEDDCEDFSDFDPDGVRSVRGYLAPLPDSVDRRRGRTSRGGADGIGGYEEITGS